MITIGRRLAIINILVVITISLDSIQSTELLINEALCSSYGIRALGMESGFIADSAITASSSHNRQSVGPQNARLNRELSGGAWCASKQIHSKNSGQEWIQANLMVPHVITKVATQGRFGNGLGVEYIEQYLLEYTRDNGKNWIKWRDESGNNLLKGNEDTYTVVENPMTVPMVGVTAVRIVPLSEHMRTGCLRFEIYGCLYKDSPISYTMTDGLYNGRFGDLIDDTYDGKRSESGLLTGGLGQLIDGIKGDDNFNTNKGFEWIGWKPQYSHISITFEYKDIQNFTLASFHTNNIFSKDIQVFASAKTFFSLDGIKWSAKPEKFSYMPDHVMEKARDVVIHLHYRIGRFIRFELYFEPKKWILISEVRIDSRPVSRNLIISDFDFVRNESGPIATAAIKNNRSLIRESVILIVFSVLGLIIIISIVLYIIQSCKHKEKITTTTYVSTPMKAVTTAPLYCEPQDINRLSNFSDNDPEYAVPDIVDEPPVRTPSSTRVIRPNNHYYASADVLIRPNLRADYDNYQYKSNAAQYGAYQWQI